MAKLEFFWDVGSPYTYLASTQMDGIRQRTGAEVVFRPFLLGGVFRSTGNEMPARVAAKAVWMGKDLRRWSEEYGVAMKMPGETPFPLNTITPMRVAVAADRAGKGEAYCHALFNSYWVDGNDVSQLDHLAAVCDAVGLDPKEMAAAAQDQEVKDTLRKNSDEAVERGAFGAPTLFVGDDLWWGNDRLRQVEARLEQLGSR